MFGLKKDKPHRVGKKRNGDVLRTLAENRTFRKWPERQLVSQSIIK